MKQKLAKKIQLIFSTMMGILLLISSSIQIFTINNLLVDEAVNYIHMTSKAVTQEFEKWLTEKVTLVNTVANELAINGIHEDSDKFRKYLQQQLAGELDKDSLTFCFGRENNEDFIYTKDFVADEDFVVTEFDWYKGAMANKGKVYISDPVYSVALNKMVITVSKTVSNENDSVVLGVLASEIGLENASNIINEHSTDDGSYMMIINDDTEILIHPLKEANPTKDIVNKLEGDYDDLLISELKTVQKSVTRDGEKVYNTMYPIENTTWNLISNYPTKNVTDQLLSEIFQLAVISTIAQILIWLAINIFNKKYIVPITEVAEALNKIKEGDLQINVTTTSSDAEEIDILIHSVEIISEVLKTYIGDISSCLGKFSDGDFTFYTSQEYIGDFKSIQISMQNISTALTTLLKDSTASANEVQHGATQIALSAENLANYTLDQVVVLEDFKNTTNEITSNILENITEISHSNTLIIEMSEKSEIGKKSMQDMVASMKTISSTTKQISEVIMVIDSLSQQINILALNAAIESARAGEAGKGFAVVAGEVRDLAIKTGEIVKEINTMISESLASVTKGEEMVVFTSEALENIINSIYKTSEVSATIKNNSSKQKVFVDKLVDGTTNLSSKVERSSAISEQNVAISQELTSQANHLKNQLNQFKYSN
ncbi:hypothetical protein AN640_07145 [Candidatus Epulonipiscium fishelsonii]|uniref:Uncharacterized protein n=1 Tax=Candidatus Epulonipiscium fishelsonii TaxID=77094 RepID=A0ACC8XGT1_9FIRM|nr:hypothetical protein AN640_07145 [Epulopiscium sp. SCG-D08WGA-EpuloA1]OON90327.1 MAG: hypothetical protein ATN32_04205 [Epulopiscium sp. AS2M-Bin002]